MTGERPTLSRPEAAWELHLSVRQIDLLVQRGELRPLRIGTRVIFERAELERFIAKLREEANRGS